MAGPINSIFSSIHSDIFRKSTSNPDPKGVDFGDSILTCADVLACVAASNLSWLVGGNALVAPGFIGSTSAFDVYIGANSTVRMAFPATGEVRFLTAIEDTLGVTSMNTNTRGLYSDAGVLTLDYNIRQLFNSGGDTTVNWEAGLLGDSSGLGSIGWEVRALIDTTGAPFVYWANNSLGIGITPPTARIHVQGLGATSATYAAIFQNSTPTELLSIRNDGLVSHMSGNFDISYDSGSDTTRIGNSVYRPISVRTNSIERMFIARDSGMSGGVFIRTVPLAVGAFDMSSNIVVSVGDVGAVPSSLGVRNIAFDAGTTGIAIYSIGNEGSGGANGETSMRFNYNPVFFGGIATDNNNNYYQIGIGQNAETTVRVAIANGLAVMSGNFGVGTSTIPASMTAGLYMVNGTDPSADVANQFSMYCADVAAGNASPHFRTENGGIVKLFTGAALTTQLTTITASAPGTPDYAIQDLVAAAGFGFVTADEGQTFISVVINLQTRVAQLEARLQASGQIA
jgi:hypothetical protein